MRPLMQNFILKSIKNLNHNVYELEFEGEKELEVLPGQFITFMMDNFGARAYSILEKNGKNLKFIIKKIEIENGGKGGSKYLCELKAGAKLRGIGPSGTFVLKENSENKLFLGTGTGFVPLYFQIKYGLENNLGGKYYFIFGVRYKKDLFYEKELSALKEKYPNFSYSLFLSREDSENYKKGYIIKEIKEAYKHYKEAYICGNPIVVEHAKEELLKYNFSEENIFEEKY